MRRTCAEHGKAEVCIASDARFWDAPDRWMIWATGKTILGAQLGGYAGVEVVGCLLHGCCLGQVCAPAWFPIPERRKSARNK